MTATSLTALAQEHLRIAHESTSGRSAHTIFGGTAPFPGAWLVLKTGSLLAPAGSMAIVSIVVFLVTLRLPETSKRSMVDGDPA